MYCSHNKPSRPQNCIAVLLTLLVLAFHPVLRQHSSRHDRSGMAHQRQSRRCAQRPALARCVVEINPIDNRSQSLSLETGDDGQFDFAGYGQGNMI